MKLVYKNITFNFLYDSYAQNDLQEESDLGDLYSVEYEENILELTKNLNFSVGENSSQEHILLEENYTVVDEPTDNIFIFSVLLNQKETFVLDCNVIDPYWVIHDLFHAINDVVFYEQQYCLAVNPEIELKTLEDSLQFCMDLNFPVSFNLLRLIDSSYKDRFLQEIDLTNVFMPQIVNVNKTFQQI